MTASPTINPTGTPRSSRDPAVGTTEAEAGADPDVAAEAGADVADDPVAGALDLLWLGAGCSDAVPLGEG